MIALTDDAPAGNSTGDSTPSPLPSYGFSPGFLVRWFATAPFGRRRSPAEDGASLLARYPAARVVGLDHVPQDGPFIVVANHYERPGMNVWWVALLVSKLLMEHRGGAPIRWMITDRFASYRFFGLIPLPERLMALFLRIVARSYELLLVARDEVGPRAPMLREAHRTLHREGRPLGIMPEAGNAEAGGLGLAPVTAESGAALAWLSRGEAPLIPVGVFDDADGRLAAVFGEPFTLARPGRDEDTAALTDRVMWAVAALLPPELRGVYGSPTT